MRTSLLIGLSSLIGLSGCATGSTVERCQAAAAKHGVILEDFGPSTTELLVDAEMLTERWPETGDRPAAECTITSNRLTYLQVGDRVLIRR